MSREPGLPRTDLLLALAFFAVVVGGVTDLALDAPRNWLSPHVLVEVALISTSLGLAWYLWWGWHRASVALREARSALAVRRAEGDRWQQAARQVIEDLGRAVDRQFETWDLSGAERGVALLLLKGLSHKEVAARTGRSERTIRQHAVSVYRKSGLGGRAALAAYFLGDLTLPSATTPSAEELEPDGTA